MEAMPAPVRGRQHTPHPVSWDGLAAKDAVQPCCQATYGLDHMATAPLVTQRASLFAGQCTPSCAAAGMQGPSSKLSGCYAHPGLAGGYQTSRSQLHIAAFAVKATA